MDKKTPKTATVKRKSPAINKIRKISDGDVLADATQSGIEAFQVERSKLAVNECNL